MSQNPASPNPFDALGGGGFDVGALLQQAQQMQADLAAAQQRLADTVLSGSVAGGAVTVRVNGVGDLIGIDLAEGAVASTSADDLADLADLVVAAYRAAKAQAEEAAGAALGPVTGGLGDALGGSLGGAPDSSGPRLGF